MKASKLLYSMIAVLALLGASCTDDTFMDNRGRVEEGIPVRVQLKFRAEAGQVITRAEQTEEYENRIENAYVFVFDGGGTIVYQNFFTEGSGLSFANGDPNHSSGTITFDTKSMNDATIVGIANLRTETSGTAFPVTKEELDDIADLKALKAYVMRMNEASVSRGGLFMMTGYAKDSEGNTVVTIPGSESGKVTMESTLKFERTDAKVKFVVTTSPNPPEGKTWTNFSFTPSTWEVKQVPQQSYLLEAETGDYNGDDATYFSTPAAPFEAMTTDPSNANLYTGGSFVFYMPENKKTPIKSVSEYAQRDAWDTTEGLDDNGNRTFTNANAHSTYVEMTGTVSYQDNEGMLVNADVRFIVHLGYVTNRDGQTVTPDPNDYNTERNGFYTYNVKVRGVNDIIVEVRDGIDNRPGYEGDVVYSTTDIFEFDSHYDRRLIQLNKSAIGTDMKWSVNTPFSRGIHDATDDDKNIEQNMRDYRWIKFAINADYGVDNSHFVKYPGDQNYNDPFPMAGAANNEPAPYYPSKTNARLLDVNQLIRRLQREAADPNSTIFYTDEDGETKVAITVFVDEHLYFNHPLTNQSGEENRSLWKLTTDKEDRQLHIIAQGSKISPDGNSSVVNSTFTFKQRPISTIFNVDKEELKTAWGLESVMEAGRMQCGLDNRNTEIETDNRNGRLNTLNIILGPNHTNTLHWTDVLNTDDHYALNSNYNNALYACMLRNRDLNGDNIIQANEIRWYLAAIDQLTDIYLGEYALDEKSRLYPNNPADRENKVRWHYTSSSLTATYNWNWGSPYYSYDSWVLWAEEGASRGMQSDDTERGENGNALYSYRCVRNLGLPLDAPDEIPADLISYTDEGNGYYLIDITNMNVKARRTNYEVVPLPAHNERSANNLPYAKFRVHANTCPEPQYSRTGGPISGYSISFNNAQNWGYFQTNAPYPAGYRIPNQRELLIMTTRMPENAWPTYTVRNTSGKPNYICQTAFSLDGQGPEYNSNRDGFLWSAGSGVFFLQNSTDEKGYVRPVQDVQ
ncbi:fimbrial protein [Phocaeicola barnesiae]|uniref:fimbrial protein n=1 Tax=Phocaeicola barnesiae TaxID=376804 RepID=UPI001E096C20|nr:fimbrial protein [Phocaeicola barnesiae]HJG77186.1 fimbrial protein [Phocaeicola barnesiae]